MIKSLTSLRGIFILFIFLHHCPGIYAGGGSMAVAFFFILGGFSMKLGYSEKLKKPEWSYKDYIAKRAIKFYPLHWMCLMAAALPSVILGHIDLRGIGLFGINAALLQSWIPVRNVYFSYNAVSWYLADTMFFALLFPALCRIIMGAGRWGRAAIAVVIAAIYAVVAVSIPTEMHHAILYISPAIRLADFVFGMYLAIAYMALKELPESRRLGTGFLQVASFLLIVALVVESCLLSEDACLFAPLYWPLVGLLLLTASLSSEHNRGGAKLVGKQMFASPRESEFRILYGSSAGYAV